MKPLKLNILLLCFFCPLLTQARLNNVIRGLDSSICENFGLDHQCKKHCQNLYTNITHRKSCESLTLSQIKHLEELHDFLILRELEVETDDLILEFLLQTLKTQKNKERIAQDELNLELLTQTLTTMRDIEKMRDQEIGPKLCKNTNNSHSCRSICNSIYLSPQERSNCRGLSISKVNRLEEVHDFFKTPNRDELTEVVPNDFNMYLNLSINPLGELVSGYSKFEAEEFILWLISNEDFAKKFKQGDNDNEILTKLLEGVFNKSHVEKTPVTRYLAQWDDDLDKNIHEVFLTQLDGNHKLMEVLIQSGSQNSMNRFMDYINNNNSHCAKNPTSLNCFTVYCKIGYGIKDYSRENWLLFEKFKTYITGIILKGVNRTSEKSGVFEWQNLAIQSLQDTDDWLSDLCIQGEKNLTL